MPPFSEGFQPAAAYYKLAWMADGYPGRRNDDGTLTAHPLYGVYVIDDYVKQLKADPDNEALLPAIVRVAGAARDRMARFRDSLVFWYTPAEYGTSIPRRYYSGLTQSYWADTFHQVSVLSEDESFAETARLTFRSLLIPEKDGGVYESTRHGVAIAELPGSPRYMPLNGWMSALVSIHAYGERAGVQEALDLVRASSKAMLRMLPLFDAPHIKNSRYGIAGYQTARLVFSSAPSLVRNLTFNTPAEGAFKVEPGSGAAHDLWVFRGDVKKVKGGYVPRSGYLRANLFVSRAGYPDRSSLAFQVRARRATKVQVQLAVGTYEPLGSAPMKKRWVTIATQDLMPGTSTVKAVVPWWTQKDVAYGTNFLKLKGGKRTNVYHMIHIKRLRQLHKITGNASFGRWADRWRGYVCAWPKMDLYRGMYVSHGPSMTPAEYCSRTSPR